MNDHIFPEEQSRSGENLECLCMPRRDVVEQSVVRDGRAVITPGLVTGDRDELLETGACNEPPDKCTEGSCFRATCSEFVLEH